MITDAYKAGVSPIWHTPGDGNYSVHLPQHSATVPYWVPHLGLWQATPYSSSVTVNTGTKKKPVYNTTNYPATQQSWQQVWAALRDSYVAWQYYARALGTTSAEKTAIYNSTLTAMERNYGSASTMDSQVQAVCATAKSNGVVVYGIAFEAPTNGQTQIRNCATSDAHCFSATTVSIGTAFKAVANNISQLRLTQ